MIEFNELVSNYLRRELRQKKIGNYYPSDCGTCMRKAWYSYKLPRAFDIELLKVFEMGNLVHSFMLDVLNSEKNPHIQLVGSEVPFRVNVDEIIISGRVDSIITVKIEDEIYLVEIKSVSESSNLKEASKAHVLQLQLYMHYKGIRKGIIVYIKKNNLKAKQFEISYDYSKAKEAIDRFRDLHKYLVETKLPDAEAKAVEDMNWQCKSCQWENECGKDFII